MEKSDKTHRVLVTAGGAGIGRAIAERFRECGADVYICDVSEQALDETLQANPGMRGMVADVGEPEQVEQLCHDARDSMGGVDVLVNNAGVGGPRAPVEDVEYDDWESTLRVNLSGMFYCAKQVVPLMKAQRCGSIINICTASVKTGLPNRLPYIASKAGVLGLSYNLARELGPYNIRSNSILPGLIDNARGRALIDSLARENNQTVQETERQFQRYISLRTFIKPEEIADVAVFLASNRACHVTGQEISVDGNLEWEM